MDADLPVDEAFHLLEEEDLERVPVVEDGRLVGVLSRSVLQRRLAEDEPPELPPPPSHERRFARPGLPRLRAGESGGGAILPRLRRAARGAG